MDLPSLALQSCAGSGWAVTPDLWLRLPVIGGLLLVAGWVGAQRFFPGQQAFVGLHAAMLFWLLASGFEQAATTLPCKVSLALLQWPAIIAVPTLWTLFLHQHVHSLYAPLSGRRRAALALPVLLITALAWRNGAHGLLYGPGTALPAGPLPQVVFDRGVLFYAAACYAYVLLLAGSAAVALAARRARGAARRQWLGFGAIALAPWVANIGYVGFGWRLFGTDPTPLSFAAAVAGFAWLIRANELFDVVPMARGLLFRELPDAVLVIDREQRVMESNAAARALAGGTPAPGTALADWPTIGAPLAALLAERAGSPLLELPAQRRLYELRVRPVGQPPRDIGRLLLLRDVTEQQRAQAQVVRTLAERNVQLQQVAVLQAELQEQALRDPLTGLWNRRALAQRFAEHVAREPHARQPLVLALLDVDHFKRINDLRGHAAGYAVLRELGGALQARLRSTDLVFRFGGEEFALLMPGTDAAHAQQRIDVLRGELAAQPAAAAGLPRITFSAGVAEWPHAGATLDTLLQAADAALYRAKAAGRDRVEAAGTAGH